MGLRSKTQSGSAEVVPRRFPAWLFAWTALLGSLTIVGDSIVRFEHTGLSRSRPDASDPVAYVMGYVDSWDEERDPLVTLPNGIQAKRSNVEGVVVDEQRYFYQLTRESSFDPLRLGNATAYTTVAFVEEGTQWEVLIYTLNDGVVAGLP